MAYHTTVCLLSFLFFFKQKTAYDMRISDWSSDVCSSDLINNKGMYEPIHGSAPDIAGQNKANPIATILSVGMMFKYSFDRGDIADRIDAAVKQVLNDGVRTGDIAQTGEAAIGTREMGNAKIGRAHV